jgi:beta-barrel assembly-enhancing protease
MNTRVRVCRWLRVALAAGLSAALIPLALPAPPAHAQLFSVSEQQEIQIGHEVEKQLRQKPGFADDPEQLQYVREIALRLAHVSERPNLPWTYHILNDTSVNALAAPGGFIFVTHGLLDFVKSRDELAFVLGHETTHVAHRHAVDLAQKNLQLRFGALLITQILFGGNWTAYQLTQVAGAMIGAKYSRDKEFEADHFGVIYAKEAGFDPTASLAFFERLQKGEKTQPGLASAFEDHPDTPARIAAIQSELRQMGYQVLGPATPPSPLRPAVASAAPAQQSLH